MKLRWTGKVTLSRRKAMGALVGGAIAGPQAAKEAMENVKLGNIHSMSFSTTDYAGGMVKPQAVSDLDRVTELKNIIAGKFTRYQQEELDEIRERVSGIKSANVNALKSTSYSFKCIKEHENYVLTTEERFKSLAKQELKQLLRYNPLLG